jgi:hypothetical protein
VAGELGAPAQVEAGTERLEGGIEPAELVEHVATHEHAARADGQDVGASVVLPLVGLPARRRGDAPPAAGDLDADLDESAGLVPADDLGSGHADRGRAPHRAEQLLQGRGPRCRAVVHHPDPLPGGVAHARQRGDPALDGGAERQG